MAALGRAASSSTIPSSPRFANDGGASVAATSAALSSLRWRQAGQTWRTAWQGSEVQWCNLRGCMFKCIVLGIRSLLEATIYLCTGSLYIGLSKDKWTTWVIQLFFVTVNIAMMAFIVTKIQNEKPVLKCLFVQRILKLNPLLIGVCSSLGPLACIVAAVTALPRLDVMLVPLCYLSHCLESCFLCMLSQEELLGEDLGQTHTGAAALRQLCGEICCFSAAEEPAGEDAQELDSVSEPPTPPLCEDRSPGSARRAEPSSGYRVQMPMAILLSGMVIITSLWLVATIWAFIRTFNGMNLEDDRAMIEFHFPEDNNATHVFQHYLKNVSIYFRPAHLVCHHDKVFMADGHRLYEKWRDGTVTEYPCSFSGHIQDIDARCDRNRTCSPVVLLRGVPPVLFDCSSHRPLRLLQTESLAKHVAMREEGDRPYQNTVVAAIDNHLVQYKWDETENGFVPFWVVARMKHGAANKLTALDLVGTRLLAFFKNGTVFCQELQSAQQCGRWTMLMADRVQSGCAYESNGGISVNVLIVDQKHQLHFMSADLG